LAFDILRALIIDRLNLELMGFFQDIVSLTKYLLFEDWQSLIDFMLAGFTPKQAANSS
jgi:hypothetical protein